MFTAKNNSTKATTNKIRVFNPLQQAIFYTLTWII